MILGVNLQVVSEVCLPEEDSVAVLVGTAELLQVLVSVTVAIQPLLTSKTFATTLKEKKINRSKSKGEGACAVLK